MDPEGYISFRSSSTVLAEGVYQFLRGGVYGAIWGVVTPFPAPGSAAAAAGEFNCYVRDEASSGLPTFDLFTTMLLTTFLLH